MFWQKKKGLSPIFGQIVKSKGDLIQHSEILTSHLPWQPLSLWSQRERGKCAETWKMHTLYYLLELQLKNPKVSSRGIKVDPGELKEQNQSLQPFFLSPVLISQPHFPQKYYHHPGSKEKCVKRKNAPRNWKRRKGKLGSSTGPWIFSVQRHFSGQILVPQFLGPFWCPNSWAVSKHPEAEILKELWLFLTSLPTDPMMVIEFDHSCEHFLWWKGGRCKGGRV